MKSAFVITACTLVLAAPLLLTAEPKHGASTSATPNRIELAPRDADKRGLERYLGASVTGANGEGLGEVRDFLADERTSRLAFAVIASGGMLGLGDTLRLVRIDALKWLAEDTRFTVNLGGEEWRELPVISENDLEAHRIAVGGKEPQLMRIGRLPGTDVHVLERDVGEIEDVVLDFSAGTVRALLDPDREFAGSGDKVLVPLGRFVFAEGGKRLVSTTLTRADFNDLYASWNQTTGPREPGWVADQHRKQHGLPPLTDQNPVDPQVLLPTGRDSSAASDAVSRIREALRVDARFAHAGLKIVQENGRIVLDGVATDVAERREIERIANAAAGEMRIESRLKIRE